jgi:sulfate permease, SulP family
MRAGSIPASLQNLHGYTLRAFGHDVVAGVTVGLVALPLAMAFAIASGLTPQSGIYCAVITGFIISALGGSRCQIGGPTGAFVVVVAGIIAQHGVNGLFMCTMMAGVILVILGATGMGTAVNYLPRPVVVGFTNGIAVLIASTQVKDFLGLEISNVPAQFAGRMAALAGHLDTVSWTAAALGISALAVILAMRRFVPAVPGTIVALVGGTAVVMITGLPTETIGTRFGGIPSGLPPIHLPHLGGGTSSRRCSVRRSRWPCSVRSNR